MNAGNAVIARNIRVRILDEVDAATLETSVQTFLAGLGEGVFLSVHYQVATTYSAMILYTR